MTAKESKAVAWLYRYPHDGEPDARIFAWFTDGFATDKSATTYDPVVAGRWIAKGWPVTTLVLESLLAEAERERDAFKQHCDLLTHKVITCGVAAQNPDATLTTRGVYATKWDSPQAQHVRKLRAERDALQSRLDAVVGLADGLARRGCDMQARVDQSFAEEAEHTYYHGYTNVISESADAIRSAALGCATTGEMK